MLGFVGGRRWSVDVVALPGSTRVVVGKLEGRRRVGVGAVPMCLPFVTREKGRCELAVLGSRRENSRYGQLGVDGNVQVSGVALMRRLILRQPPQEVSYVKHPNSRHGSAGVYTPKGQSRVDGEVPDGREIGMNGVLPLLVLAVMVLIPARLESTSL